MPALSLAESLSAALTHALFPIQPGILEALQEEDFLLLHSCVANSSFKKRRRVNNAGVCYSVTYEDFEMTYRCTAEVTARAGLANYRPGRKLNEASLPWFANGVEPLFGVKGGILIYEEPVVTHLPCDLPGITFTVAREDCDLDAAQVVVPEVEAVTTRSWPAPVVPVSGARYDLMYDAAVIWIRRLNLTGPETGLDYLEDVPWWQKVGRREKVPATLTAFLAQPYAAPAEVSGENEIEEVITFTAGTGVPVVLRAGSSEILPLLATGTDFPPPPIGSGWLYGGTGPSGDFALAGFLQPGNATTLEDFWALMATPGDIFPVFTTGDGATTLREVYSFRLGAWVT